MAKSGIQSLSKLMDKLRRLRLGLSDTATSVVVTYSTAYALFVHEDLEAHHEVGQAKYLEEPFRTHQGAIRKVISDTVGKLFRRRQPDPLTPGLILGGLFLQRKSQELVPVDTGALKASARTRKET